MLVVRFATPLSYANAVHFRAQVAGVPERDGMAFGVARAGQHEREALERSGLAAAG